MRFSDWRSDVGSSDLCRLSVRLADTQSTAHAAAPQEIHDRQKDERPDQRGEETVQRDPRIDRTAEQQAADKGADDTDDDVEEDTLLREIGRASCRERVCQYV